MIYAKIQVTPNRSIHFFTTHMQASYLDSSDDHNILNDKARIHQVDELAEFIHSKIDNTPDPAIVAGDFNINARVRESNEATEYKYLVKALNKNNTSCSPAHLPVRDLLKEHTGQHPSTYADASPRGKPRETVLTHPVDLGTDLCIDHMFYIDTVENSRDGVVKCRLNSTQVEEFFVQDEKSPFSQLSDHYGVSTVLDIQPS
eukprot:TRINITY_DN6856_c0_g1_i2.p1 TRINITY_DN6856_c0_g1~~TRINITY_DN6856_c0_g1_i2.p1  ORF type:complete len:202 (-),score=52.68 TRINITY_DN6856_c0_g1_i2:15-620(-)